MSTKAQQIREALLTEIRKVAGIGAVSSQWKLWKDESSLPAAYVILDGDDQELLPTRSKQVHAHFRIATILQSETPQDAFDDLRGAIETEIEDDPALGGLADAAWVSGTSHFATATSIAGPVYVRDLFVDVHYRHPRAQP
jgi:hypothetical protein